MFLFYNLRKNHKPQSGCSGYRQVTKPRTLVSTRGSATAHASYSSDAHALELETHLPKHLPIISAAIQPPTQAEARSPQRQHARCALRQRTQHAAPRPSEDGRKWRNFRNAGLRMVPHSNLHSHASRARAAPSAQRPARVAELAPPLQDPTRTLTPPSQAVRPPGGGGSRRCAGARCRATWPSSFPWSCACHLWEDQHLVSARAPCMC